MKKLFLALILFAGFGCNTTKFIEKSYDGEVEMKFVDFQPYIAKGFVFSTGEINQNYLPVGILYYTAKPDKVDIFTSTLTPITDSMIENGQGLKKDGKSYIYSNSIARVTKNLDDLLEMAYEFAVRKGANGIIHLDYSVNSEEEIIVTGSLVNIDK